MEPVSVITGQLAPLPRANVDTDAIIPKQYLKRVERSGFGPFLFYEWAYDEEGEMIPDFILNQPDYAAAEVLVSGPNFGSGSSREHAPWSIEDRGFKAIIAPSFADIFYNNCINIGLLPIVLTDEEVATLTQIADDPDNLVTIDLEDQTVTTMSWLIPISCAYFFNAWACFFPNRVTRMIWSVKSSPWRDFRLSRTCW